MQLVTPYRRAAGDNMEKGQPSRANKLWQLARARSAACPPLIGRAGHVAGRACEERALRESVEQGWIQKLAAVREV